MPDETFRPLFDFAHAGAVLDWDAVNDGVMGGRSDGRVLTGERSLVFKGTLSLENNGGFASVRSRAAELGLAEGDDVVVRVRGDGRTYLLNLYPRRRTTAFSYRAELPTVAGDWLERRVPLGAFAATQFGRPVPDAGPPDPAEVAAVGFMLADKTPGPFRLEVAWVKVARG